MSDTQQQPILLQRRMQQRQILAMMGIKQWVRPDSLTMNVANISSATVDQPISSERSKLDGEQAGFDSEFPMSSTAPATADYDLDPTNNTHINTYPSDQAYSTTESSLIGNPIIGDSVVERSVIDNIESSLINAPVVPHSPNVMAADATQADATQITEQLITPLVNQSSAQFKDPIEQNNNFKNSNFKNSITEHNHNIEHNRDQGLNKVAPFDLQGGRYGNWVLMVDIQALNNDSQKLWQNITQALTLSCETASFPICEGMDTAELANASLAGYLFKIGRSEEISVAALTELPDGLTHPNIARVPTLDQMLADASLKRDLWQQLSSSN